MPSRYFCETCRYDHAPGIHDDLRLQSLIERRSTSLSRALVNYELTMKASVNWAAPRPVPQPKSFFLSNSINERLDWLQRNQRPSSVLFPHLERKSTPSFSSSSSSSICKEHTSESQDTRLGQELALLETSKSSEAPEKRSVVEAFFADGLRKLARRLKRPNDLQPSRLVYKRRKRTPKLKPTVLFVCGDLHRSRNSPSMVPGLVCT
jgi:hypothetical protein